MSEVITKTTDEKFCTDCGVLIRAKAEICPKCGVRQSAAPSALGVVAPNGKSKLAAALFGIFLGGIGIHKFYLGKAVQGVFYILFCWTFIPSLLGLIEGILLLTMSDQDFVAKYGQV